MGCGSVMDLQNPAGPKHCWVALLGRPAASPCWVTLLGRPAGSLCGGPTLSSKFLAWFCSPPSGGKLQKESEFSADAGWLSWGVGLLLVRPLRWTVSSVLGSSGVPPEETLVVLDLVKVGQSVFCMTTMSDTSRSHFLVP